MSDIDTRNTNISGEGLKVLADLLEPILFPNENYDTYDEDERSEHRMLKKIGKLEISKDDDYKGTVVKALIEAGFTVIKDADTIGTAYYIIAKEADED